MKDLLPKGPFIVRTSFAQLKLAFKNQLLYGNNAQKSQASYALKLFELHPQLALGFDSLETFEAHKEVIQELMSFLFPEVLKNNELKSALHPLSHSSFYDSTRLQKIKENCIEKLSPSFITFYDDKDFDAHNFLPYAVILNKYYGYDIDFSRPTTVTLNTQDDKKYQFRATYNGDFLSIKPTDKAIDITPKILDELLLNTNNYEVWEKYFPENSWLLEGFAILNLTDTTIDEQIDVFKEHLIASSVDASFDDIIEDIRKILGIKDLVMGATQIKKNFLIRGYDMHVKSIFLHDKDVEDIQTMGCQEVKNRLINEHKITVLPNVDKYAKHEPNNRLHQKLKAQGFKSVAFIPIVLDEETVSILEIGAFQKNQLNAINIIKLNDILPFIYSFIKRNVIEFDNQINAIIQKECTSIHPAVKWKFEEEAYRFYVERQHDELAQFREVSFENVIPLYGQIDISGSSKARNKAIQNDLKLLLEKSLQILQLITKKQKLPFYEHLLIQTKKNIDLVQHAFHTNTEQVISDFFEMELYPVLKYFAQSHMNIDGLAQFLSQLDDKKSLYLERKKYDATVDSINQELAQFLDEKQIEAQAIFPHYFQKYKTDGVEHDLYVGQSIAQEALYHESVLYNLRLWQLQIMCEMEAYYYAIQEKYPMNLKVASMVLAYDTPMSIRYRIDEKKFDVDGAYNVRYEMIKKRIDKAHIKNTNERLTQPHKLAVVYFNFNMEKEYLEYFKFLQSIGYLRNDLEIVEIEDLQGAIGMKAMRATINLSLEEADKVYDLTDMKRIIPTKYKFNT